MKKLVYLLILSLCLSGVSTVTPLWSLPARAEKTSEAKAEEKTEKSKKDKKSEKKESEKKKSKKSEKSDEAKEDVYTYNLNGTGRALLSQLIKDCKIDLSLSKVKGIEGVSKNYKKYVAWEKDEENKKDYVFTVVKNFKDVQLRVKTKNSSFILKLKNGKVEEQTEVEDTKASEPAAAMQTVAEAVEKTDAPAEEKSEEDEVTEVPAEEKAETAEKTDAPAEEAVEGQPATTPEKTAEGDTPSQDNNPEQPAGEGQGETPEDETPENETPEGETPEGETPEGEIPEGETPEGETPEGETPEGETPEGETPEGETPEGETPGGETPEGESPEGETPEGGNPEGEGETQEGGDALPEDAEAWFERGGAKFGGTLKQTLALLEGGEKVYVRTKSTVFLPKAPAKLLADVELLPDAEVFTGDYTVCLSQDNPAATEKPALLETTDLETLGDEADLYLWVLPIDALTPGDDEPTEPEEPVPQITVKATDYYETTWRYTAPRFDLSGIPEGKSWSYAAIVYDERFIPISGDYYIPLEEGQYTLRFAILDEYGDILSISDQFIIWLDWTIPEDVTIETDEEDSLTMYISASDELSGVAGLSLNGGKSWNEITDGEIFTYTASGEKTFSAGSIQVRDNAGNVYIYDFDITLEEPEEEEEGGGGGGGGGGGSGEAKPVPSHASGDGEEGVEYDALTLEIPDEPMAQLTVGGEAMQLTLTLESAQEPEAPVGKNQYFTACLRRWNGSGEDAPDTLLLSAELDANLGDEYSYDWRFNGEVYRMLANSGIKYVALQVGDDVAAFPTEGFTGGTKYTELKMLGVSTRRFDYTLTMKVNLNPGHVSAMSDSDYSQECDLSIRTEVENMNYELSSSPKSIMYFYNVYLGPEDMLDQPFGEYKAQG